MRPLPSCIRIVAAANGKPAQISVRGTIGSKFDPKTWNVTNTEDAVMEALAAIPDGEAIDLRVHSKGGDFGMGLGIHNAIARRSANVTGYNAGFALSAGSLILAAAGKVICPKSSVTMLHCASTLGYLAENADQKRKNAQMLDVMDKAMAAAYASKIEGKTEAEILGLMKQTTWWSGDQAKENGFADCVEDDDLLEEEQAAASEEELTVLASFQNIPERFKPRLGLVTFAGSRPHQPQTKKDDPMRDQIIAALAAGGITLAKDATEEQVLAAWNKYQSEIQATREENERHRQGLKARVEKRVLAAVDSKRIKPERREAWVARGLADESSLDELDEIPTPQAANPPANPPANPVPVPFQRRGAPPLPAPAALEGEGPTVEEKINAKLDQILTLQREAKRLTKGHPRKQEIAQEIGLLTAELGKIRGEVMEHKVTYSRLHPAY